MAMKPGPIAFHLHSLYYVVHAWPLAARWRGTSGRDRLWWRRASCCNNRNNYINNIIKSASKRLLTKNAVLFQS